VSSHSFPARGLDRPLGFQEAEGPEFLDNRHMKVVRLSTIRTGRLYPQEGCLVLISVKRLSCSQGHNVIGRIKSLKNSSDSIGNRTRDLATMETLWLHHVWVLSSLQLPVILHVGNASLRRLFCWGIFCMFFTQWTTFSSSKFVSDLHNMSHITYTKKK
jgi:hypothetical protein